MTPAALESILAATLYWPNEDRRQREMDLATNLISKEMVEYWSKRGVRVRRGCYTSASHATLMVKVSNGKSTTRVDVRYKQNGHGPEMETVLYGKETVLERPLTTIDDVLAVMAALAETKALPAE